MAYYPKTLNPEKQGFRKDNARKTNKAKFPDGYLYIIRLADFDIYKIGVSQNPKRRLQDLKAANPFTLHVKFCAKFTDVYSLEEQLLDKYSHNSIKGEWFNAYEDCIEKTTSLLSELYIIEKNGKTK